MSAVLERNHFDSVKALVASKNEVLEAFQRQCESLNLGLMTADDRNETIERRRKDAERARTILENLNFARKEQRREDIAESARNTCHWTLFDDQSGLRTWLREGYGVFWIRGKPGAGKSTLMKYLTKEAETTRLLQQWSGKARLLIADHYFWYPGSTLQRSHIGLFRSLLHSILLQDDDDCELLRIALPRRWEAWREVSWNRSGNNHEPMMQMMETNLNRSKSWVRLTYFCYACFRDTRPYSHVIVQGRAVPGAHQHCFFKNGTTMPVHRWA